MKRYAKEVSTALINPWGYLISKGGKCLLGAGIDLAFQYLLTGILENGNINVLSWAPKPIVDKFDFYDASISCFDAVVDTEGGITGAAQTFLINIPVQAKREYDKVKDVSKMDWKAVLLSAGKEAIIELATSLVGNAITNAKKRIDLYISKGKCTKGKLRDLMTSLGFSDEFATKIFGTAACFTKNTKIKTSVGYKSIEAIKVGDLVLSHDPLTNQTAYKTVTDIFISQTNQIFKIYAGSQTIATTPEHPFYINNQWLAAKYIHKGTLLYTNPEIASANTATQVAHLPRSSIEVDSIAVIDSAVTVYNFEVSDFHTYFVTEADVLVHNRCTTLAEFLTKTLKEKTEIIEKAWKSFYPEIFQDRKFLEDLMDHYKYVGNAWLHTYNSFPTIDFFNITDLLAVSMKTTRVTNYSKWVQGSDITDNIKALKKLTDVTINGVKYDIKNIKIALFVERSNYAEAIKWIAMFEKQHGIKLEIDTIEKYIK